MDDLKTILIVDDTELNVNTLMDLLDEKYDILAALDGEDALEIVKDEDSIDLILLDIMMPDIKGYEVCKKIKANEKTKDIKIIVLSAYLDDDKFAQMKEHGADVCFSKPLPLPRLKDEVAKLLGLK